MATIRSRGKKYHVQIRKIGYPPVTRSFSSISVARRWAKSTEADMERRLPVCIPNPFTVGDLLERYELEVIPSHKGNQREIYKSRTLRKYFSQIRLCDLSPSDVRQYRDIRLKTISKRVGCIKQCNKSCIERMGSIYQYEPRNRDIYSSNCKFSYTQTRSQ